MKVDIKIDKKCKETEVLITTREVNNEVTDLYDYINKGMAYKITAYLDNEIVLLSLGDIVQFYSFNQKVYAATETKDYIIKQRLFELEEQLKKKEFIRISNTEIINLKRVISFDMSIKGNIIISLKGNRKACVSRRYIPKIRKQLGV